MVRSSEGRLDGYWYHSNCQLQGFLHPEKNIRSCCPTKGSSIRDLELSAFTGRTERGRLRAYNLTLTLCRAQSLWNQRPGGSLHGYQVRGFGG